ADAHVRGPKPAWKLADRLPKRYGAESSDSRSSRAPTPPVRLNPELPRKLKEIMNTALEKSHALRCQSAAELRSEDYRTPMSESEQHDLALKLLRVESALVRVPGEPHGIRRRPSHHMTKMLNLVGWFDQHKKKSEDK
ncbi:MAG: hypothetical protein ACE5H2_07920, partial [Terriglobia bacterium]